MSEIQWITKNGVHIPLTNDYMNKKLRKQEDYNDTYEYGIDEESEDAYDQYVEMSDESYNNLDEGFYQEIQDAYVGNEYSYQINENLRNGIDTDKNIREALDYACKSYTSKRDMASTRFVNMEYLRNAYGLEIPQYGDVDRSKVADNMKQFIGSEIQSKGYTSVSLNESGNGMFNSLAVKMKVNLPKGTKMFVADNVGEYEAILGRDTKMILKKVDFKESKVQGFEKEYGKILLTYEVVKNDKD